MNRKPEVTRNLS